MRIVNREQFLQLPTGVVFMKYAPMYTEDLAIKGNTTETSHDFAYADITGTGAIDTEEASAKTKDRDTLTLISLAMGEDEPPGTVSFKTDLENYSRDGCFADEQLFMVYEQPDIDKLIAKLQSATGAVFPEAL